MRLRSAEKDAINSSSPEKKENIPNFLCKTPLKKPPKTSGIASSSLSPKRTPQKPPNAELKSPATPLKRILDFDLSLSAKSPYSSVKAVFWRSHNPDSIICRDSERAVICGFIQNSVLDKQANSLYISGNPGTGKTALTNEVLNSYANRFSAESIVMLNINCMSFSDFPTLLHEIAVRIKGASVDKKIINTPSDLYRVLTFKSPRAKNKTSFFFLIVLDEIDHFAKSIDDQENLYSLFEIISQQGSCLSLIGIANALDLTDRLLPRLKCRNLEPKLLHFSPYTVEQIAEIITHKIASISQDSLEVSENAEAQIEIVSRNAIELASRKVASCGDLRKALDIIKAAINLAESEKSQVSIKHILKALESSYGVSSKAQAIKQLSVYLQAILGCLLPSINQAVVNTKQSLFEAYCELRKSFSWLTDLSFSEFGDAVTSLEVLGLLSVVRKFKKDAREKIHALFTAKEYEDAIRGNSLMTSLQLIK